MIEVELSASERGKRNRRKGAEFERKVRERLEQFYYVVKFSNNIDVERRRFVPAKSNRFNMRSCGFPDFLLFTQNRVFFLECKVNGKLDKEEKEKVEIIKSHGFGVKLAFLNNGEIEYKEL